MRNFVIRPTAFKAQRHARERGSALLIVLVFSAIIAIMLYREMPIAAFESQRQKEALLISRGNEYKRGVKLFVRKVGRYPSSLNELEATNRMRFLRHRYVDPLTGKDDWRLIHAGPGGTIIDSKVQSTNGKADNALGQGAKFGGFNNSFSGDVEAIKDAEPASAALRQRPAATQNAANAGGTGGTTTDPFVLPQGAAPVVPQDPNGTGPSPFQMAQLQQGQGLGQVNGGVQDPNQPAGSQQNSNPQSKNAPVFNRQLPFDPSTGQAFTQGQNGGGVAGGPPDPNAAMPQQQTNGASNLSQQLNTQNPNAQEQSPAQQRNGGLLGAPANIAQAGAGNGQIMAAGGIAGVASKASGKSIKAVNEQTKYSLWEFYYDLKKDQNSGAAGALGGRQNSNMPGQQLMPGGTSNQSTGFGQSTTFGQPNGQTGGFGQTNTSGQAQPGDGVTGPSPALQTPPPIVQQ